MNKKKWSRDWETFDWNSVYDQVIQLENEKQLQEIDQKDIGISRDEFLEFLEWLKTKDSSNYYKFVERLFHKRLEEAMKQDM